MWIWSFINSKLLFLLKFYLKKLGPFTNHTMKNYLILKRIKMKIFAIYSHLNMIKKWHQLNMIYRNKNNFNFWDIGEFKYTSFTKWFEFYELYLAHYMLWLFFSNKHSFLIFDHEMHSKILMCNKMTHGQFLCFEFVLLNDFWQPNVKNWDWLMHLGYIDSLFKLWLWTLVMIFNKWFFGCFIFIIFISSFIIVLKFYYISNIIVKHITHFQH